MHGHSIATLIKENSEEDAVMKRKLRQTLPRGNASDSWMIRPFHHLHHCVGHENGPGGATLLKYFVDKIIC